MTGAVKEGLSYVRGWLPKSCTMFELLYEACRARPVLWPLSVNKEAVRGRGRDGYEYLVRPVVAGSMMRAKAPARTSGLLAGAYSYGVSPGECQRLDLNLRNTATPLGTHCVIISSTSSCGRE